MYQTKLPNWGVLMIIMMANWWGVLLSDLMIIMMARIYTQPNFLTDEVFFSVT